MQPRFGLQAINVAICVHFFLILVANMNPLMQELEEIFGVPQEFGSKRVILRFSTFGGIMASF